MHVLRTLSPLKKLAYQRICDAQDAMAAFGKVPRYATETELVAKDALGKVVWNPIDIADFRKAFEKSPYISAITAEGDSAFLSAHKHFNQMEVSINGNGMGRKVPLNMPDERLTPKRIVPATDIVKHQLQDYCKEHGIHKISFDARTGNGLLGINSGYHSNMSLYSAQGENLFGRDPELLKHCAGELLQSQAEASVMLLPTTESLKRISPFGLSALGGTPSHINHTYGKFNKATLGFGSLATRRANTLTPYMNVLRDKFPAIDQLSRSIAERSPDFNRIENRLAGADSCPYIVGAFDTATLQHAVTNYNGKAEPLRPMHLPKSIEEAVEIFKNSTRMKHILGEELHGAYLAEYIEPLVKAAKSIH